LLLVLMAAFLSGGSPMCDVTTQCWAVTLCCRFDFVTAFRDRQLENERRDERNDVQRRATYDGRSIALGRGSVKLSRREQSRPLAPARPSWF